MRGGLRASECALPEQLGGQSSYSLPAYDRRPNNYRHTRTAFRRKLGGSVGLLASPSRAARVATENGFDVRLNMTPPSIPGIYLVALFCDDLVPVTQDKRYVADCARVTSSNVKIGKARNLALREANYWVDFGRAN